jgi:signal transduction histidine kinase
MFNSMVPMESCWKSEWCLIAAMLICCAAGVVKAQPDKTPGPVPEHPWQVVVLNATDPTLPAFMAIDRGTRAAFAAPDGPRVDVHSETLDVMRFPRANFEAELLALISKKYENLHIDAVIAVSPPGLDFAARYRDRLWPNAPIVFHSIPEAGLVGRPLPLATTGIYNRFDYAGTVDLALRLRPETKRLLVLSGAGEFDRLLVTIADSQLARYSERLHIEYVFGVRFNELVRRVSELGPNDAVLVLSLLQVADGPAPRDVLRQLTTNSRAPIYGTVESYIGQGIVAGAIESLEGRGRRAAELVLAALAAPGGPLPPPERANSVCAADANALSRLGLDEERLPAGCDVRFRRPSLWRDYKRYVIGATLIVALQFALIAAFLWQRRGRHRAEIEVGHRRAELAKASRLALAGELTASIAHEINQPLGAILANAGAAESMLRLGSSNNVGLLQILGDIRKDDLRASEIIRRVRGLVTKREIECAPVDVNAIVEGVASLLRVDAARREVAIETGLAPALTEVLADRVQLEQALVNLCVNAMDAMSDAPVNRRCLVLRTRVLTDGRVEIDVMDNGPGITAEQLPRLFDSFFTTKTHGMGLGLSITRSIVEAHGGTLKAENRRRGGACFSFDLPAGRTDRSAAQAESAKTTTGLSA